MSEPSSSVQEGDPVRRRIIWHSTQRWSLANGQDRGGRGHCGDWNTRVLFSALFSINVRMFAHKEHWWTLFSGHSLFSIARWDNNTVASLEKFTGWLKCLFLSIFIEELRVNFDDIAEEGRDRQSNVLHNSILASFGGRMLRGNERCFGAIVRLTPFEF